MQTMNWSPQQAAALDAVSAWLRDQSAPFFYLAGYAGTGKTTLARHFAEGVDGAVLYGSFTGKAASVMREKGCPEATTIHRLIYTSRDRGTVRLKELQERLKDASPEGAIEIRKQIRAEVERLKAPSFTLNPDSPVRGAKLVIIDECSMVNSRMADDLLSFGKPVLVLGDPAQLPPVGAGGFFTKGEPDFMLTEVHRQARESGILELATRVRGGDMLSYCRLSDAMVIPKEELDRDSVPGFDQILVGRNATRRATNVRMRTILGRTSELPEDGDRLVCLRNNHELGLLNGEQYTALHALPLDDFRVGLTIQNSDGDTQNVEAQLAPFLGKEVAMHDRSRDIQEFDFGYVLTTHKAQGSQWPRVIVFDESYTFRQHRAKWLYTAITRASHELVVVR